LRSWKGDVKSKNLQKKEILRLEKDSQGIYLEKCNPQSSFLTIRFTLIRVLTKIAAILKAWWAKDLVPRQWRNGDKLIYRKRHYYDTTIEDSPALKIYDWFYLRFLGKQINLCDDHLFGLITGVCGAILFGLHVWNRFRYFF
jgi:hypothetical protein